MTDASFTSLISSTINSLNTSKNNYNTVSRGRDLPEAFKEAGKGLLLIEETLQNVKTLPARRNRAGDRNSIMSSLKACNSKAKLSECIFKDVAQAPETERFEQYKVAVRNKGNDNPVEVLVMRMMNDVCDLAEDSEIEAVTRTQVKQLREAIEKLSKVEPSVPKEQLGNSFFSYGSSKQFNATGGSQNNNTGSGNIFTGSFNAPVNFGSNPS